MNDLLNAVIENLEEGIAFISQGGALLKNNHRMTPYLMMEGFFKTILDLSYVALERKRPVICELRRGRSTMLIKAVPSGNVVAIILREVYFSSIEPNTLREGLEEDLKFAKNIQKNILPLKKSYSNLSVDYIYEPSESLSGDIFDVFMVDESHVGMYVADVSGHGIAAAMMTMFVKQIFTSIGVANLSPAKTLEILYEKFYELHLPVDKYITCFYAIYSIEEEVLYYSNAGHNCPPFVYDGERWSNIDLTGYPLFSLFPELRYKEEHIKFGKNHKLFLYTDGITENKDDFGELFGEIRLGNIIRANTSDVLRAIREISNDVRWRSHEDDYAAILIERK